MICPDYDYCIVREVSLQSAEYVRSPNNRLPDNRRRQSEGSRSGGGMAGDVVVVFDFDRTIIDDDSDRWVVTQMGLTQIFNELRNALPWTSLMVYTLSLIISMCCLTIKILRRLRNILIISVSLYWKK